MEFSQWSAFFQRRLPNLVFKEFIHCSALQSTDAFWCILPRNAALSFSIIYVPIPSHPSFQCIVGKLQSDPTHVDWGWVASSKFVERANFVTLIAKICSHRPQWQDGSQPEGEQIQSTKVNQSQPKWTKVNQIFLLVSLPAPYPNSL